MIYYLLIIICLINSHLRSVQSISVVTIDAIKKDPSPISSKQYGPFFSPLLSTGLLAQPDVRRRFDDPYQRLRQQIATVRDLLRISPDHRAVEWIDQAKQFSEQARTLDANRNPRLPQAKLREVFEVIDRALNHLSMATRPHLQPSMEENAAGPEYLEN